MVAKFQNKNRLILKKVCGETSSVNLKKKSESMERLNIEKTHE